ncbi:MAG TPA: S1C family serine protease [Burkholderiales bacterium]|nr:S1C family serine protease [Burkholderiales bacterium]
MAERGDWAFPKAAQPQQSELAFDLDAALDAVVQLRSEIPEDAFTAQILGTERAGNGVVIGDDGLVLTIGYLITEAQTIWLATNGGAAVAGHPLAYDQVTGFGLVQPLGRLGLPALARGSIAACEAGDDVLVIGHGGREHALKATVLGKREFAGYWEYVLDEALFTSPAHPQWGGAAVVDMRGKLVGIGSLLVEEAHEGRQAQGNMVVPVDLLEPILGDMLRLGRADRPARPWLGMYAAETDGRIVVGGLAPDGPAHRAGVRQGDLVLEVDGSRVDSLADMLRRVWRIGPAGAEIPLTLARDGALVHLKLRSADRGDFLKKPSLH